MSSASNHHDRAAVLIGAALHLLNQCNDSTHMIDPLSALIPYDGTDCDGSCLRDDLEAWLEDHGAAGEITDAVPRPEYDPADVALITSGSVMNYRAIEQIMQRIRGVVNSDGMVTTILNEVLSSAYLEGCNNTAEGFLPFAKEKSAEVQALHPRGGA
jgi:hypothetical protein